MPCTGGVPSFLSYSRKDADVADALWVALGQAGIDAFLDRKSLLPGQFWPDRTNEEIVKCECFVLLWSEHAASSPRVRRELSLAEAHERPIVPVLIGDVSPPAELANVHHIELRRAADAEIVAEQIAKSLSTASTETALAPEKTGCEPWRLVSQRVRTSSARVCQAGRDVRNQFGRRGVLIWAGISLVAALLGGVVALVVGSGPGHGKRAARRADATRIGPSRSSPSTQEESGAPPDGKAVDPREVYPSPVPAPNGGSNTDRRSVRGKKGGTSSQLPRSPTQEVSDPSGVGTVSGRKEELRSEPDNKNGIGPPPGEPPLQVYQPSGNQVLVPRQVGDRITIWPDRVTIDHSGPDTPGPSQSAPTKRVPKKAPAAEVHYPMDWPVLRSDDGEGPDWPELISGDGERSLVDDLGDLAQFSDLGTQILKHMNFLMYKATNTQRAKTQRGIDDDMASLDSQLKSREAGLPGPQSEHAVSCKRGTQDLAEELENASGMTVRKAYKVKHEQDEQRASEPDPIATRIWKAACVRHEACNCELKLAGDTALLTEVYLAKGSFNEALTRLEHDLQRGNRTAQAGQLVLRVLQVVALVGVGNSAEAKKRVLELAELRKSQPENFRIWRTFFGIRNLIRTDKRFSQDQAWLLRLLYAVELQGERAVTEAMKQVVGLAARQ